MAAVIGLTNSIQYASHAKVHKVFGENPAAGRSETDTGTGSGPGGAYKALDLRLAYSIPSFGGGVPQTVAIFEQGGFSISDVQEYLKENDLPNVPVTPVLVNGYDGALGNNAIQLEAVLDIDMVIGINPELKSVLVYEDGQDPFPVALVDAMDRVAEQNLAGVLSISYGADEIQQGTEFMQIGGKGLGSDLNIQQFSDLFPFFLERSVALQSPCKSRDGHTDRRVLDVAHLAA